MVLRSVFFLMTVYEKVLGFDAVTFYEIYYLSLNPVDILPFDNLFLDTDIAQVMIFKGKR